MNNEIILQVTSGRGPAECCRVVALVVKTMLREAEKEGVEADVISRNPGTEAGTLVSAIIRLKGNPSELFAKQWIGTILWIGQSPYRRFHKRKNWYVGVTRLEKTQLAEWNEKELEFQTLRSSGPGGQHVNKTESAVRAIHPASGLTVTASDFAFATSEQKTCDRPASYKVVGLEVNRNCKSGTNAMESAQSAPKRESGKGFPRSRFQNGCPSGDQPDSFNYVITEKMITKDKYSFILERKKQTSEISKILKEEFIGLDGIIDEIVALISPWLFFPEAQVRPTIINLWGLTGTGKTALVKRLVELLDMKTRFLHLDMGEFSGDGGTWIKAMLTEELEHFHEKPSVLCFDEFQFARTLDNCENELSRDKMRVLWGIFDSGKIYYEPSGSGIYLKRAESAIQRIQKCLRKGMAMDNGEVTGDQDDFKAIFSGFYFDVYDRYGKDIESGYFLSQDFVEGVKELFMDLNIPDVEIMDLVKSMSFEELAEWLFKGIQKQLAVKQLDLSRSLIFILGNLDEAFYMSNELSPDLNADEFYSETLKINIADIKTALQKRFRNEQIARLGNNHLIYPCFNSAGYKVLINRNLERIRKYVEELAGVSIQFDSSVIQIIYDEGVFPSQGVRPVLTTIKQLVESYISVVICRLVETPSDVNSINWSFYGNDHRISFLNENGFKVDEIVVSPKLKLHELRKTDNDDVQLHIAIHESGHAIVAALTLRILPSIVVTKTVSSVYDGFCRVNYPERLLTREVIRKKIMIALAGFVAEKMVLGVENTSAGVDHDIERASEWANRAIKEYAMGSDPVRIQVETSDNNDLFFTREKYSEEAMSLIQECMADTEKLLERNKLLLLKMSQYLTAHSVMREEAIGEMIRYYGVESWLKTSGFIEKDQYYKFKDTIQQQIEDLERVTISQISAYESEAIEVV